jgi:hypothetical protein
MTGQQKLKVKRPALRCALQRNPNALLALRGRCNPYGLTKLAERSARRRERDLIRRFQLQEPGTEEALAASHRHWLQSQAQQFRWANLSAVELEFFALVALYAAAFKFDVRRDVRLRTFALPSVRGRLHEEARTHVGLPHGAYRIGKAVTDTLGLVGMTPHQAVQGEDWSTFLSALLAHPVIANLMTGSRPWQPQRVEQAALEALGFKCYSPGLLPEEPDGDEECPIGHRRPTHRQISDLEARFTSDRMQKVLARIEGLLTPPARAAAAVRPQSQGAALKLYVLAVLTDEQCEQMPWEMLCTWLRGAAPLAAATWQEIHAYYRLPQSVPAHWAEVQELFAGQTLTAEALRQWYSTKLRQLRQKAA